MEVDWLTPDLALVWSQCSVVLHTGVVGLQPVRVRSWTVIDDDGAHTTSHQLTLDCDERRKKSKISLKMNISR